MRILNFQRATLLVDAVRRELLPRLAAEGFVVSGNNVGDDIDDDDDVPAIDTRRVCDKGVDIINIQFDPRGWPCFVINAARARGGTAKGIWEDALPLESVSYDELPERISLMRVPQRDRKGLAKGWFGLPTLSFFSKDRKAAEKACSDMWALMPQLSKYFQTGEVGPNMLCTVYEKTDDGKLKVRLKSL